MLRIALVMFIGLSLLGGPALAEDEVWTGVYKFQSKLAEQGNIEAQFKLGEMHQEGLGVPADEKQALVWYTRAAEQGHTGAQERIEAIVEAKQRAVREAAEREKARQQALVRQREAEQRAAEARQREAEARERARQQSAAEKARQAALAKQAQERARQAALAAERLEAERRAAEAR